MTLTRASSHSLEYFWANWKKMRINCFYATSCFSDSFSPWNSRKTVGGSWQGVHLAEGSKHRRKGAVAPGATAESQIQRHKPDSKPCLLQIIWLGYCRHLHCQSDFKNHWLCLHGIPECLNFILRKWHTFLPVWCLSTYMGIFLYAIEIRWENSIGKTFYKSIEKT